MNLRIFLLFALPAVVLAADSKSGLDTAAMNTSVDPCVDFYQYACGNWVAHNPIPADRARWGRFTELSERNEKVLLDIVQGAAANASRSATDQKIGDFYAACMDTATIEKKGLAPLKPELEQIAGMSIARGYRRGADPAAPHRRAGGVSIRRPAGRQGFLTDHRHAGAGRALAAGPRLLFEDRSEIGGDATALRGAHEEDVPVGGRQRGSGGGQGADGARPGDHPGQGFGRPCVHARPRQALPHHGEEGPGGAGPSSRGTSISRGSARRRSTR